MKRSGFSHPKLVRLCRLLGIDHAYAVGIAESLWHITALHTPAGNIGKWGDQEIADQIGFTKASGEELVTALIEAGFLDRDDTHRLVIHDWADHADDSTHACLARKGLSFASGVPAKLTKLNKREREIAQQLYGVSGETTDANGRQRTQSSRKPQPAAECSEPRPFPAIPCHSNPGPSRPKEPAAGRAGIFKDVSREMLRDDTQLLAWFRDATTRPLPVIQACEANLLRIFGAAERSLEHGDNPPALFASLVSQGAWEKITQQQESRAHQRLRLLENPSREDHQPQGSDDQPRTVEAEIAKLTATNAAES